MTSRSTEFEMRVLGALRAAGKPISANQVVEALERDESRPRPMFNEVLAALSRLVARKLCTREWIPTGAPRRRSKLAAGFVYRMADR